jgi:cytosine permease
MAVVWGYALAYVGMKGIRLVAGIAVVVNVMALVTMLAIFFTAEEGLQFHSVEEPEPLLALGLLVQMVTAFFATAGAAAPEFGLHNRTAKDVVLGGIAGVFLPMIFAGALAMLTVTGARALNPAVQGYGYITACAALSASFPVGTDLLLAITCIPAAGVFAFIASNSFTVMLPGVRRLHSTMTCATVAIAFAITGIPDNLEAFITIAGALFAPICGAMAADFVQAVMKWPHTRPGVNYAGYGAWVLGFLVGILPVLSENETLQAAAQPAVVYSFIIGFVAYIVLGNVGLKPYRKRIRKRTSPRS